MEQPDKKTRFLDSVESVVKAHGERLSNLAGRELTAGKVVWDVDDDSWFADEPVVLIFGDVQLEIVFWQLDGLALNWNTIEFDKAPNWFECYGDLNLEWRACNHDALTAVIGQRVTDIALVELCESILTGASATLADDDKVQLPWLLHALKLQFGKSTLTIFNALDENGISSEALNKDGFRHTEIIAN